MPSTFQHARRRVETEDFDNSPAVLLMQSRLLDAQALNDRDKIPIAQRAYFAFSALPDMQIIFRRKPLLVDGFKIAGDSNSSVGLVHSHFRSPVINFRANSS